MYSGNTIAVLGGTGIIGTYIIKQLLISGYKIKILETTRSELVINNDQISVIEGRADDYLSILKLLENSTTVINAVAAEDRFNPNNSFITNLVLKAAKNFDIKKYINISDFLLELPEDRRSLRTRVFSHFKKLAYPRLADDLQKEYKLLQQNNLNWVFVRYAAISEKPKSNQIKTCLDDCPGKFIHPDSIANFVVSLITDNTYVHKAPFVSN